MNYCTTTAVDNVPATPRATLSRPHESLALSSRSRTPTLVVGHWRPHQGLLRLSWQSPALERSILH